MKYILIIGDGMADNPVPALGGKTPLQYADTPVIDALAARGEVGEVCNCPPGLPVGSDTAILSIFGNDPRACYTGRAPLEAAGSGVALRPGDLCCRCSMVTLEEGDLPFGARKLLSYSGGLVGGAESVALAEALLADPDFCADAAAAGMTLYPTESFRHIAVQRDGAGTAVRLAPPHEHVGQAIGPWLPSGGPGAEILCRLMARAHRVLDRHPVNETRRRGGRLPANGVWFWAEGTAVTLEPFSRKYGKTGAVISAVPLCHGIARLSGLEVVQVAGATGDLHTNYEGKVAAALRALEEGCDFAALHIEAPDECTHVGDLHGKLQAISWLDSRVAAPLVRALETRGEDFRLLLLSDHKTLTGTRQHDGGPVPFLFYDSRVDTGAGLPYNEENGARGRRLPDGCAALMPMLFGGLLEET